MVGLYLIGVAIGLFMIAVGKLTLGTYYPGIQVAHRVAVHGLALP